MGPLAGVRVLDLTRVLAGPLCGQILADMGCDVVKVERPVTGDDTRSWIPPSARGPGGDDVAVATYFQSVNRGKRSVAVDITNPSGAELVASLGAVADVVIENFKAGDLARHGLDHVSLRTRHPGLVYCSITGFGQTGPNASLPGYDPIVQALCGMMGVTGAPDGEPSRCGVAVIDVITGVYAALAVAGALYRRRDTGCGQYIDLSLLDVGLASMVNVAQAYLAAGVVGVRMGNAHPSVVPSQVFHAADGHLMLTVGNDAQFERLCRACGHPELAQDPRFATNESRVAHRDVLVPVLEGILGGRERAFWLAALGSAGVPCAPVNDIREAFADRQVHARGMRIEVPDPVMGSVPMVASPLRFSESAVEYRRPPPALGAHTAEVLSEWLGMGSGEIRALERKRVF